MLPTDLPERLASRVSIDESSGCWNWIGGMYHHTGYARIDETCAHRVVYIHVHGSIPEGLEIDHLCRNRRCVNPEHLEAVTHQVNVRRGLVSGKTQCPAGHPYGPDDFDRDGWRHCRECHRLRQAKRLAAMTAEQRRELSRRKYWNHREKNRAKARAYYQTHKELWVAFNERRRKKNNGL